MRCPSCDHDNGADGRCCAECGTALEGGLRLADLLDEMLRRLDQELGDDGRVAFQWGAALPAELGDRPGAAPTSRPRRLDAAALFTKSVPGRFPA